MNRDEFLQIAQSENIRPDAFNLDGQGNECYALSNRQGRYDVYYSERGLETGVHHFATEHDALKYLLEMIRADQTTRF